MNIEIDEELRKYEELLHMTERLIYEYGEVSLQDIQKDLFDKIDKRRKVLQQSLDDFKLL